MMVVLSYDTRDLFLLRLSFHHIVGWQYVKLVYIGSFSGTLSRLCFP